MIPSIFPPDPNPPFRGQPIEHGLPRTGIRIARAKLLSDWYAYYSADAYLLNWWPINPDISPDPDDAGVIPENDTLKVICRDPCGHVVTDAAGLAVLHDELYIPKDSIVLVWQPEDAIDGHWELVHADPEWPLRAFEFLEDLIQQQIVDGSPTNLLMISGYLMGDVDKTPVDFYPGKLSFDERQTGTAILMEGLGRKAGQSQDGTRGWARWVPQYFQEEDDTWTGHWEIVVTDCQQIIDVVVLTNGTSNDFTVPAAKGQAQLWWRDFDTDGWIDSGEAIEFFNSISHNIHAGAWLRLYYDKTVNEWWVLSEGCWASIKDGNAYTAGNIIDYSTEEYGPTDGITVDKTAGTITIIEGGSYYVAGDAYLETLMTAEAQVIVIGLNTIDPSKFTENVSLSLINSGTGGNLSTEGHSHKGTQTHFDNLALSGILKLKAGDILKLTCDCQYTNIKAYLAHLTVVKVDD